MEIINKLDKKVVIGMSGGVDSSVACGNAGYTILCNEFQKRI